MRQVAVMWVALVVGPLASGAAFVGMLAAPKRIERILFIPAVLGLAAGGVSVVLLGQAYGRADAALYALAFLIAALAGGYALASTSLGHLAHRAESISLNRPEAVNEQPYVVLSVCVEPPTYSLRSTAQALQQLSDEGLFETSVGLLPFIFLSQKARYRSVGGTSPAASQLAAVAQALQRSLGPQSAVVHPATCRGANRLASVVARGVAEGHHKIITVELAVACDSNLNSALAEASALRADEHGVELRDVGCVGKAERIITMLSQRILQASAPDPASVGVIIVCHGQPEERAQANPAFDDEELLFANRLRMMLTELGFDESNVRPAWAEWNEPDVTSAVRHLAATGCSRIVVCPALNAIESMATRIDLEASVRLARTDSELPITVLPAWGADDAVVETLRALVVDALESE